MSDVNPDSHQNATPIIVAGALVLLVLGIAAIHADTVEDYFLYIAEYAGHASRADLIVRFFLNLLLYFLFIKLNFDLVFPTTFSPTAERKIIHAVDLIARVTALLTPTVLLIWLFANAASADGNGVISLAVIVLILSAFAQLAAALDRYRARRSSDREDQRRYRLGLVADRVQLCIVPTALVIVVALCGWLWWDVVGAANYLGGLGVLLLLLIALLTGVQLISILAPKNFIWWALVFGSINFVICDKVPTFFRHEVVRLDPQTGEKTPKTVAEIVANRSIPSLSESFARWLLSRPRYQRITSAGRKYPVFIVSAQGGGQYAAYHSALFLARLYDRCPNLKDHVFAISSVSGGSLGAAVVAELLRTSINTEDGCDWFRANQGAFEQSVRQFFSHDFVTPVLARGFFFDLPALLLPQLRVAADRAEALELAIERAWQPSPHRDKTTGLIRDFYGQWSPSGQAPALFLNATSTNYGIPVVLSELYMAQTPSRGILSKLADLSLKVFNPRPAENSKDSDVRNKFIRAVVQSIRANEYTRPRYYNILEFEPQLQLNLSTALVLSARFPYVTPAGVIARGKTESIDDTLRETASLQLIDGGFSDNSGISTSLEIIKELQTFGDKNFANSFEFYLISFGHSKSVLQRTGERRAQSELIAPLSTFEAVRQARRLQPEDALSAGVKRVYSISLFDHQFQAPLSWTLSERVRKQIEDRSGGGTKPTVCCALEFPQIFARLFPSYRELVLDLTQVSLELPAEKKNLLVAPNQKDFNDIIDVVKASDADVTPH